MHQTVLLPLRAVRPLARRSLSRSLAYESGKEHTGEDELDFVWGIQLGE